MPHSELQLAASQCSGRATLRFFRQTLHRTSDKRSATRAIRPSLPGGLLEYPPPGHLWLPPSPQVLMRPGGTTPGRMTIPCNVRLKSPRLAHLLGLVLAALAAGGPSDQVVHQMAT